METSNFTAQRALEVFARLACGAHPSTAERLPAECVTREPDVLLAIAYAREALAEHVQRAARRANAPRNLGAPWTVEEELLMIAAFDAGRTPQEIAVTLERTLAAIEARLEKVGKISAAQRTTQDRFRKQPRAFANPLTPHPRAS